MTDLFVAMTESRESTRYGIKKARTRLVIFPAILVMLPGALVMLPLRLVMFPASAEEEIAKVKSDAQRIDLKRFIFEFSCKSSVYWGEPLEGITTSF